MESGIQGFGIQNRAQSSTPKSHQGMESRIQVPLKKSGICNVYVTCGMTREACRGCREYSELLNMCSTVVSCDFTLCRIANHYILRFQNAISCCYLSSDVSYNTPIFIFKVCRKRDQKAEMSLTEFSADRGVAAFKPLSAGLTN